MGGGSEATAADVLLAIVVALRFVGQQPSRALALFRSIRRQQFEYVSFAAAERDHLERRIIRSEHESVRRLARSCHE